MANESDANQPVQAAPTGEQKPTEQPENKQGNEAGNDNNDESESTESKESPEDRISRLERQLKQAKKKAGVKEDAPNKKSKSSELDYGMKAYLRAEGIKAGDETDLVTEYMENTGKDLEQVLGSKYFQAELKELREAKTVEAALPGKGNRANNSARDKVEYWIAKGELPPADQVELRRAVVNAKIKKNTDSNTFTSNPVVQ